MGEWPSGGGVGGEYGQKGVGSSGSRVGWSQVMVWSGGGGVEWE